MNSNEKTNSQTKELSPYILIQPQRFTITIGKDIVRTLGFPTHVCLRINETNHSFAIIPCKEDDVMSFKVPEKLFTESRCVFRLYSKQFVLNLILKYDLDPCGVYECNGAHSPKINAVIVSLADDNLKKIKNFTLQKAN